MIFAVALDADGEPALHRLELGAAPELLVERAELVSEGDELLVPNLGLELASKCPGRDLHGGVDPVPVPGVLQLGKLTTARAHDQVVSVRSPYAEGERVVHEATRSDSKPYRGGPDATPVGSRLELAFARASGKNFMTPGALAAVRARIATPERFQMVKEDRLWADLLWSMSLCCNLFGDIAGTSDGAAADDGRGAVETAFADHLARRGVRAEARRKGMLRRRARTRRFKRRER